MPIYEYRCKLCQTKFEFFHKSLSADEKITCPKCGANEVVKVFSTFATNLSGESSFTYQSSCDTPSSCGCSNGMCNLN